MSDQEAQFTSLKDAAEQQAGTESSVLKRSSSVAGNPPPSPAVKRPSTSQDHVSASESLKYVYIVQQASYPQYGEGGDEILCVFSSLQAANAKAHDHIETEYSEPEEVDEGADENGCFWWSAGDVGEGDGVRVYVQRWEVKR